jgi:hypothetical protein
MRKKIKFATEQEDLTSPQPSKKYIPSWYKQADKYIGGKPILNNTSPEGGNTIKLCIPFLDSLINGYTVELAQDVQVRRDENNSIIITYHPDILILEQRPIETLQGMPIPHGYEETAFAWKFHFALKTPKGYSSLFVHPLNRHELPFITVSAIVDSDYVISDGWIPFFLKEGFEGIIPKGTPLVQIIPFKRDNWEIEQDNSLLSIARRNLNLTRRVISGYYRENHWRKKQYS